ncbi:hypothetical protein UFOVP758_5 [uncultured Caudovirales phage]|uniref:Uncharacterized protein n=1 Tax=uncultured Caudovirales phage TaxID=2100421 RepID=A0A6J7X550_9CAUD|nr:hypothetical protein UFOVP758_5 [uncultured Caudovirales phage]
MTHLFYRKQLPRDLLDTFARNDQEMVRHLIGDEPFLLAKDMALTFQFLLGNWDMNTQMIDTGIQIMGEPKKISFWLLKYQPK